MMVPDPRQAAAAPEAFPDVSAAVAALRAAGADRFDPVQFRYIDALAERASLHQGSIKRLLDAKLAQAVAALQERFFAAQSDAQEILDRSAQHFPYAARELQRLYGAGEFKALRSFAAGLSPSAQRTLSPLGALLRQLEQHVPEPSGSPLMRSPGARRELKTIRTFKQTLSKLSVHKQVAQALEQAPKNAGPINSHMLVLRSLALMRDISPDYLNRFITYADALLCLEQSEKEKPGAPKKTQGAKSAKK
ncbi:DUF2894 domain-containing protein [Noviherbaspirillum malthae]|uniref:DUF2894 domain-containing protein n=1 Tax=Noviherbaspirillum malthae TaxID=1260987 RepID=UPI00188E9487|nr:DUF2894 domain-containing protein [Noviherbaspirillum malthae]